MLVFEDENRILSKGRVDDTGEQRWHVIGAVSIDRDAWLVLLVVHVYREDEDGEEIIRIISARRTSPHDFRRYQEQEVD